MPRPVGASGAAFAWAFGAAGAAAGADLLAVECAFTRFCKLVVVDGALAAWSRFRGRGRTAHRRSCATSQSQYE